MAISCLEKMQSKYSGASVLPVRGGSGARSGGSSTAIETKRKKTPDILPAKRSEADLAPTVKELIKILVRHPIKVRATMKRTSVLAASNFRNEHVLKRLSELVFHDDECWSFLYDHPDEIIDGHNFMAAVCKS